MTPKVEQLVKYVQAHLRESLKPFIQRPVTPALIQQMTRMVNNMFDVVGFEGALNFETTEGPEGVINFIPKDLYTALILSGTRVYYPDVRDKTEYKTDLYTMHYTEEDGAYITLHEPIELTIVDFKIQDKSNDLTRNP